MKEVWFLAAPFTKKLVTLALESGVDGIVAEAADIDKITSLGRVQARAVGEIVFVALAGKADEQAAAAGLQDGRRVVLRRGWEIIPVENILAQAGGLFVEVGSYDEARLAAGILEKGVDGVLVTPEGAADLKRIVAELKLSQGKIELVEAVVKEIRPVGLGHRVCVDTLSVLRTGQGMLIGNSSAFTFLVHAETESNPYVAARPFRINAGAVHAYAVMPGDKTRYLEEIASGDEVLIVGADGSSSLATVGRAKVEVRPMLLVTAEVCGVSGAVFLQNAETIRLAVPGGGAPVSVVKLAPGDKVLCRVDAAGRHFGMRICEEIKEG
ncbi:MAG: 3-dehydroquinate synthase II family protein [Desulfovibrionaceae bacterium]|nr:3-dehydroquinate synthase II family protein [Desulfovibrionaceae bacterium]MBF0514243.1 3-dehydroquinate synthase II family protein [Desulfovibrionaceae bacterium]